MISRIVKFKNQEGQRLQNEKGKKKRQGVRQDWKERVIVKSITDKVKGTVRMEKASVEEEKYLEQERTCSL